MIVLKGGVARSLGQIREVVLGVANDIWVTGPVADEVLIPALKDVVVSVDLAAGRVVVRDVPGLTSPEDRMGRQG